MQFIKFQHQSLSLIQSFFIERSIELLYMGSIDSYRVKMHNPLSILIELQECLREFQKGKIKHFDTINCNQKNKKSLVNEVITLLTEKPNYLVFESISEAYLITLCKTLSTDNYIKLITTLDILIQDNADYINRLFAALEDYLVLEDITYKTLEELERTLNYLYSSLINHGFSKNYIYRKFYGEFNAHYSEESGFEEHFSSFKTRMLSNSSGYTIYFKINTSSKVVDALSQLPQTENIIVLDELGEFNIDSERVTRELEKFRQPKRNHRFLKIQVEANDFLAALKIANANLAEYLDVINLGLSGEYIRTHSRALVIDDNHPEMGAFQIKDNILDGKYKVEKEYYLSFSQKLPTILANTGIETESKDKIKSAVRYLRLGNISTEIEHKFINYWIGLEYLFSNYETKSTITRLKTHLIKAHALAYVKRNLMTFYKNATSVKNHFEESLKILMDEGEPNDILSDIVFYDALWNHKEDFPLLAFRAKKLKTVLFDSNEPNAKNYLIRHMTNLEIHLTRIYRLRNEIIHDAATNTTDEQVSSHLRYYLTFMLNEIINYLSDTNNETDNSIEQYFLMNEITFGNIEHNGYALKDSLKLEVSLDFLS